MGRATSITRITLSDFSAGLLSQNLKGTPKVLDEIASFFEEPRVSTFSVGGNIQERLCSMKPQELRGRR